jgi:hypothetical protein
LSKIVRLFNQQEKAQGELVKHIEDFLEMAKRGEITNFLVSSQRTDGTVMTGYCNLDVIEKQFMLSHIQIDVNYEVVRANVDDLIEWVGE